MKEHPTTTLIICSVPLPVETLSELLEKIGTETKNDQKVAGSKRTPKTVVRKNNRPHDLRSFIVFYIPPRKKRRRNY